MITEHHLKKWLLSIFVKMNGRGRSNADAAVKNQTAYILLTLMEKP